jgi:ribulose kinase
MRDLTGLMLTRLEHEVYLKKVDSDREVLKQELCGRILIIEKSINSLELSAAKQEGKASQESVSRVQLLAYIGVIISLTFGLSAIILRLVGI